MTVEPGQEPAAPRRKFDDVASLFGTIVPAPGADPRPAAGYPVPAAPEQKAPTPVLQPPALARIPEPEPEPAPPPKPRPAPRPHPKELPWPDAFEPRPNYRRREPRNWSWLLLIPVGFVAAVGITTLDPRTIRMWLDDHILHRTPEPGSMDAPLLLNPSSIPDPPAAQAAAPAPSSSRSPSPTTPTTAPAAAPTPPPDAPILYPAIPTSPVPVPPGVDVSPPPADPADAPAARPTPIHITIQYRRNIPGSEGEARRVAALLQSYGGSIELHPNVTTVRVPTINYYNPADKAAATALGTALANEAANWSIRAGTAKTPPGTLEIWLP